MKVTFRRTGERRYAVVLEPPGAFRQALDPAPGYDDHIPHDLVHYLVEAELALQTGVFGRAARGGGTFIAHAPDGVSPRERARQQRKQRKRERGLDASDETERDMITSERLAAVCDLFWRKRHGQTPDLSRPQPSQTLSQEKGAQVTRVLAHLDRLAPAKARLSNDRARPCAGKKRGLLSTRRRARGSVLSSMNKSMKAIVQDRYGSADVLELRDIEQPSCGDDDVLIRVHAAGVDPGVWHLMTGLPYLVRFMGFGLRAPKGRVRGRDVAGVAEAVGKNVTSLAVGEAVFGICEGSFAEYARGPETSFAPKPANLSFDQAAAVPTSAASALNALRDAKLRAGQHVLVIGAAGGVGSYAVQLAKAFGALVTGVCSSTKIELLHQLGADEVIDYTRADFTQSERKFDVIVDTAGRRPVSQLRRVLADTGCLVIVGGEGGGRYFGGFQRQMLAPLGALFSQQRLLGLSYEERREDLLTLTSLIEAGKVLPVIDKTYPLAQAANAVRHLEQGHARGKVVVTVS